MKNILYLLALVIVNNSFSQKTTNTNYLPLPQSEKNIIYTKCSGLEVTFYEGSSTVSMSGIKNTKFLASGLDSIAPEKLNAKNDAYIMIIVEDEFYMDAELSYGENKYVIFKKDGQTYYNKLNEQGEYFFKQVIGK